MQIFISWSGEKARRVAEALKVFLQDVNQKLNPWFSNADIFAGQRWGLELATKLETTEYGIICATQESFHQGQWQMFEAGAISKSVKGGRLCPYLIDVPQSQLGGSPLSQFQAKEASKTGTWEMLLSINESAPPSVVLSDVRLKKYFDMFWEDLEKEILAVNRDLQPLPQHLYRQLIENVPMMLYRREDVEMNAIEAGLPVWEVNLNQAAIHVWREVIQIAAREKKLPMLMKTLVNNYPNETMRVLSAQVDQWWQNATEDRR